MGRTWRVMGLLALLTGLIVLSPTSPVQAAGVVGNGTPGSCTEAALNMALMNGGAVTFNCGPNQVTIPITIEKVISISTQIDGGGLITLDGQNSTRLFFINPGITLDLSNITLTGGDGTGTQFSTLGGGIFNDGGAVSMTNSTLSDNSAAVNGGGIFNLGGGDVSMTNSTLSGNSADDGGGIFNLNGSVNMTNSTLSGNSADDGGGIVNLNGSVSMTNSTLSGNSAVSGSGIVNVGGNVNVENTIIANSPSGGNCGGVAVNSLGGNLSDDTSCNLNQPSDLNNTEDNLGPLADNGGPTQTHLPQATSPAIDNAPCVTNQDQRGINRPQGDGCDIGSVEVRQGSTYLLCANYYTGAVTSPLSGGCGPGTIALDPVPQSFCVNSWTGQLTYTFGQPCTPPRTTHTLAVDQVLLTCVNYFTSANRWVMNHSQCTAYELPNTIAPTV